MAKAVLAILALQLLWVTEAVSYPVSSNFNYWFNDITFKIAVQNLGEKLGNPKSGSAILAGSDLLGTNHALSLAFSGYTTSAVALVAAALFLAAAMQKTNLHKD